ncbi:hypothetical protein QJU89_08560 [Pasteurella skyensis]|uniref:Uncharacterized protein n=1 Tax=Phocoenobacter skyensis TaxID=97481 RepID=A0AAJ6NB46_9PAST|nr:hypothetical protein [Pasteurella skyensis]MDP8163046.1 hypothetical protein [Pasteurella skyensis]MDP8173574.1 hypothetical protein [Pasteurella skyensis]MDP8176316.1 hypothetical protein [Pasteurella skyensis]MDP8178973.1 hypothetical protein [Pasteurella skyensis]MDP8183743.1 hypothetical protein [Pasteurella skyensis]
MKTREELLAKQHQLNVLFSAFIEEKKKHEVLTFGKKDGRIVEHYPNGTIKVVGYAK